MLQYGGMTFHGDRYVLPLKAEQRGRIPGIIHRSSKSGSTVFVEPSEAVELNNTIIQMRLKEDAEITRILSELGRLVHKHAAEILDTLKAVSVLDLIAAKTRYAKRYQAICPQINNQGILDVQGASHPVLMDTNATADDDQLPTHQVVPIDFRLGDDFDLLVITGPNTGGKTVALKTIGLIAAMAQAGIPIPVNEGSTLPVYKNIFIDVGDEQSIEQSLSTFSGHLSNILTTLKQADQNSLILLDELGAGTDPDEGAAIGRAIIDELLSLGCSSVATTHLSQLKVVAYTTKRVDNAAVEFNVETLKPTYRLLIGEPGNSNAITIAQRLGMPQRIIERARHHADQRSRELTRAIEGTQKSRRQAEEARRKAQLAQQDAQRSQQEFDQKARHLEKVQSDFFEWQAWINQLRPGDSVYVITFGQHCRVVRMQLHKQVAVVSRGAVDLEVQLTALGRPKEQSP